MRLITIIFVALFCGTVSAEVLDERRAVIMEKTVTVNSTDTTASTSFGIGGYPYITIGIIGYQDDDSVYCDSVIILTADVDSIGAAVRTVTSSGSIAYSKFVSAFTGITWYRKSVGMPPSKFMWLKFYNANVANGPNTTFKVRVFVGP